MKSIRTRSYGATNTKPSRIIATDADKNKVVMTYDYALSSDDNHKKACALLRAKMSWKGETVVGWFGNDAYHTFSEAETALAKATYAAEAQIEKAREIYSHGNALEIDGSNVKTSEAQDGTWLAAWVWLSHAEDPTIWKCEECGETAQDGTGKCITCNHHEEA